MGLGSRTSQSPSTPWFVTLSHYGFLTELVLSKIEGFGMTRSGCSAWANFSEIAVAVEERIYCNQHFDCIQPWRASFRSMS